MVSTMGGEQNTNPALEKRHATNAPRALVGDRPPPVLDPLSELAAAPAAAAGAGTTLGRDASATARSIEAILPCGRATPRPLFIWRVGGLRPCAHKKISLAQKKTEKKTFEIVPVPRQS